MTEAMAKNATPVAGEAGVVRLSIPAGSVGPQKLAGIINVKSPLGGTVPYAFKTDYIVGEPSLTVSAKKMNVFYIGVENPVSISVPGIPQEKLRPSISTGSLSRQGADWIVKVSPGTSKAVITVSAELDGSQRSMGSSEFRVKRVPDPVPVVANQPGGLISKGALLAAGGVIPKMPDDFEFELYFEITSFTFVSVKSGDLFERNAQGNRFTTEMKTQIESAKRGTKFWIENIMAKGPDGNRKLATVSLQIQ
jgi:gliding motility-associated protein GldM